MNPHATNPGEPKPGDWLDPEDFERIVRLTPLVSIDLIVRSPDGRVLLGRRTNAPAKDTFFVPGGRISKNETRAAAFRRITRAELGIARELAEARFLGVFEHIYAANYFEQDGFGTHYVVLAYELAWPERTTSWPADQHAEYMWQTEAEILAGPAVHENTKAYFRSASGIDTCSPTR
jgi:colanic acid biosynthesis protein WcaH